MISRVFEDGLAVRVVEGAPIGTDDLLLFARAPSENLPSEPHKDTVASTFLSRGQHEHRETK
eukprot:7396541-Pyramimonas_sp.AAC.1